MEVSATHRAEVPARNQLTEGVNAWADLGMVTLRYGVCGSRLVTDQRQRHTGCLVNVWFWFGHITGLAASRCFLATIRKLDQKQNCPPGGGQYRDFIWALFGLDDFK